MEEILEEELEVLHKVEDLINSFKTSSGPKIREQVLDQLGRGHGVGNRKSSVAKAWVSPGNGNIIVNKKNVNDYFRADVYIQEINMPLNVVGQKFDVIAQTMGGGFTGQSGALSLAISRALIAYNPEYNSILRDNDLVTFDNRRVERKKAGFVKARKVKPSSRR